ncbi:MAG: hypothetical protein ACKOBG_13050 [Actinomycetota bacterium]
MPEEPHLLGVPVVRFPTCGSDRLRPVAEAGGSDLHFLCADCARCRRVELGWVHRVNPGTCRGCPAHSVRAVAYAADHPA